MQAPAWSSSSLARLVSWDQQQAKAKFSEVVRRARSEGPQLVTTRGAKPVVIMSAEDYVALTENRPKNFRDLLLPGEEDFEPRRLALPMRARRVRL
jgi:prevent-host-death family protein